MKKYECAVCGYIYNPRKGIPMAGSRRGRPLRSFPKLGLPDLRGG